MLYDYQLFLILISWFYLGVWFLYQLIPICLQSSGNPCNSFLFSSTVMGLFFPRKCLFCCFLGPWGGRHMPLACRLDTVMYLSSFSLSMYKCVIVICNTYIRTLIVMCLSVPQSPAQGCPHPRVWVMGCWCCPVQDWEVMSSLLGLAQADLRLS